MTPPKDMIGRAWSCFTEGTYARICPRLFFLLANHRTDECATSNAGTCAVDGERQRDRMRIRRSLYQKVHVEHDMNGVQPINFLRGSPHDPPPSMSEAVTKIAHSARRHPGSTEVGADPHGCCAVNI